MSISALAQYPEILGILVAILAVLGLVAYFFPVTAAVSLGVVSLISAAGLGIMALEALSRPKAENEALASILLGVYVIPSAIGVALTGLVLIAAGGAISSIRRKLRKPHQTSHCYVLRNFRLTSMLR